MNYREHHGLTISEIGFGCYGLSGVYGVKDIGEYKRTIRRAYELGVNFFDTADSYGNAEQVLGEVLQPYRDDLYIATKVGTIAGKKPNLSREYILQACEASLRRLGLEHIDLYQVHFHDPETPVYETIEALESLAEQGKIRKYGIGHIPIDQMHQYLENGNPYSVMMELSAVARDAKKHLMPFCKTNDLAAITFSITGRGLLTGKITNRQQFEDGDIRNIDPLFQRHRFKSGLRTAALLREIGYDYGKPAVQMAIAWVLAQPEVICALTGPSKQTHLEENLNTSGAKISQEHLQKLEDHFAEEDTWLRKQDRKTIEEILFEPLTNEHSQAFKDLVYTIETGILQGWFTENDVFPIFFDLLKLQTPDPTNTRSKMQEIQTGLANRLMD